MKFFSKEHFTTDENLYITKPHLVLGFHGCDSSVVEKIICGKEDLKASDNPYDWLGRGIYFWENNHIRAWEYANFLMENPRLGKEKIKNPDVIGAVINLGNCLNLMESDNLNYLSESYQILKKTFTENNLEMPQNKKVKEGNDLLLRYLDCAVIETLHNLRKESDLPSFDSVRAVFFEGDDLYENAGFKEKNHIQICVRNPNCIKGYFLPLLPKKGYTIP